MRVKLIAVDLDGTLIPEGGRAPTEEDFSLIRQLNKMGILFAVNSGRPYRTALGMFEDAHADIIYICDNGCNVVYRGESVYCNRMDRTICREAWQDIADTPGSCEMVLCTKEHFVLIPKNEEIVALLKDRWNMPAKKVLSFDDVDEEILKLSMYSPGGSDPKVIGQLEEKWTGRIKHLAISGAEWFDMQNGDKGTGMVEGARLMGIGMDETVAFGDNYNDVEMLDAAGLSYVMSTGPEAVKAHGDRVCANVQDVLRQIIRNGGDIAE